MWPSIVHRRQAELADDLLDHIVESALLLLRRQESRLGAVDADDQVAIVGRAIGGVHPEVTGEESARALSWSWEIGQGVKVYSSSDRGIRDDDETSVYV